MGAEVSRRETNKTEVKIKIIFLSFSLTDNHWARCPCQSVARGSGNSSQLKLFEVFFFFFPFIWVYLTNKVVLVFRIFPCSLWIQRFTHWKETKTFRGCPWRKGPALRHERTINFNVWSQREGFLPPYFSMKYYCSCFISPGKGVTLLQELWEVSDRIDSIIFCFTSTVVMTGIMNRGIFVDELLVWRFHQEMSKVKYLSLKIF